MAKLSLDGSRLEYSTRLDGAAGGAIAVDERGSAVVLVQADVNDFAHYSLIKLDASGTSSVYRTPVGRDSNPRSMTIDRRGNVWITGVTGTERFAATPDAAQPGPAGSTYFRTEQGIFTNRREGLRTSAVNALAPSSSEPATIYAGTPDGVFKSTDNGRTWVAKNNGLTSLGVTALAVDPQTATTVYAAADGGQPLFKSEDGAESWFPLDAGLPVYARILSIAVNPQSPATVYAAGSGGILKKSVDGGRTWSDAQPSGLFNRFAAVAVDPNRPDIVYATANAEFSLGIPFFFNTGSVYRSTDGGQTFTAIKPHSYESDLGPVVVDPRTPGTVYAMFRDGIYRSTDYGENWSLINHFRSGFQGLRWLALGPEEPSVLYAVAGDGRVLRSEDRGETFTPVGGQGPIGPPESLLRLAVTAGPVLHVGAAMGGDTFVRKCDGEGSLVYSSYLGGTGYDTGLKAAVDPAGRVYLTGLTDSADFPITEGTPPQQALPHWTFLTRLDESGAIGESILLDGGDLESGNELAFGPEGRVVVGGFGIRSGRFLTGVRLH